MAFLAWGRPCLFFELKGLDFLLIMIINIIGGGKMPFGMGPWGWFWLFGGRIPAPWGWWPEPGAEAAWLREYIKWLEQELEYVKKRLEEIEQGGEKK